MSITPAEQERQDSLKWTKPRVYEKMLRYDEQLAQGKSIAIVQLQYKYACNFHCSHCAVRTFRDQKAKKHRLDLTWVGDFAWQAHRYGLAQIGISGGEPLVFKDLDELVKVIGPDLFHLQLDTNGWFLDLDKAKHLKDIGIDKVQISLDGVDALEHDSFRNHPGSHARALQAIENVQKVGLHVQVATVVDHNRATSKEFIQFLERMKSMGAPTAVVFAKAVGEWAGRYDLLCTPEDVDFIKGLETIYHLYDHTTPSYGRNLGCLAVKRMIALTAYGDILPCPWMYMSLGNIFEEQLDVILNRGMKLFDYCPVCRLSESPEWNDHIQPIIDRAKNLPVPIDEVMKQVINASS